MRKASAFVLITSRAAYRSYHQRFKVYRIQNLTVEVADKLRSPAPTGIPHATSV